MPLDLGNGEAHFTYSVHDVTLLPPPRDNSHRGAHTRRVRRQLACGHPAEHLDNEKRALRKKDRRGISPHHLIILLFRDKMPESCSNLNPVAAPDSIREVCYNASERRVLNLDPAFLLANLGRCRRQGSRRKHSSPIVTQNRNWSRETTGSVAKQESGPAPMPMSPT